MKGERAKGRRGAGIGRCAVEGEVHQDRPGRTRGRLESWGALKFRTEKQMMASQEEKRRK
jgi:hypothetical protein